jgi:hypothetical protein
MPYSYAAILLLLLAVAPQPSTSLYHTSSEILHWFGNAAKDHPGTLKYAQMLHVKVAGCCRVPA